MAGREGCFNGRERPSAGLEVILEQDGAGDCGTSSRNTVRPDARGAQPAPAKQAATSPRSAPGNERMHCNEADDRSHDRPGQTI